MIIAETTSFQLGRFTVQVRPRFDNPAFAVYIVLLADRLIGKQFSRPTESDCQGFMREVTAKPVEKPKARYGRHHECSETRLVTCAHCPGRFPPRGEETLCVPCSRKARALEA